MKHRTDYPDMEYKTKKQWIKAGFYPDENKGSRLWSNPYHNTAPIYYLPEEVHPITEEEKDIVRRENKLKREKYKEKREERQRKRIEHIKEFYENKIERQVFIATQNKAAELADACIQMANQLPAVECKNPSKIVVFDIETTGLSQEIDEILQISIIDGEGNELINSYVRPYWNESWDEAQAIHGITKDMVSEAPYLHELIPKLKGIFESAELLIAYNNALDVGFIERAGINLSDKKQYDVMQAFAPFYGDWDDYFGSFKWKKLTTAASYLGYEFNAHDSLEDVRATLHCYKCLKDLESTGKYDEVVKKNYNFVNGIMEEAVPETDESKKCEENKKSKTSDEKLEKEQRLDKRNMFLMGKSR
ncbi:MAG: 3'-5' exonuclease [Lachnospiraceae bacterium]|nr:3'-5' exonuclease [Lachnospiraceae bacterium]